MNVYLVHRYWTLDIQIGLYSECLVHWYWTLDIHIGLYSECLVHWYWTLDIHIGLYSECLVHWYWSLDIHVSLYSECLPCTSILDIHYRFVQGEWMHSIWNKHMMIRPTITWGNIICGRERQKGFLVFVVAPFCEGQSDPKTPLWQLVSYANVTDDVFTPVYWTLSLDLVKMKNFEGGWSMK